MWSKGFKAGLLADLAIVAGLVVSFTGIGFFANSFLPGQDDLCSSIDAGR